MADATAILRCNDCLQLNRVPLEKLTSKPLCGNCKAVIDVPQQPLWAKTTSFDRTVSYWPETLLVVFTAPMCIYCKIFEPVLNDLARERAGRLKIMKVDTETDDYLVQRFKIEKTPTFIVYKNAVEIIRVDGPPKEKTDLVKWIDNLMNFTSY
jgi:thioredoxin 2